MWTAFKSACSDVARIAFEYGHAIRPSENLDERPWKLPEACSVALAAYRNAGKGEQYSARYRLSKDPRRRKHTEEQRIFQLGTGLVVRVAGDDFVVVDPAFAVDESLNHDRVVTVGDAFSRRGEV